MKRMSSRRSAFLCFSDPGLARMSMFLLAVFMPALAMTGCPSATTIGPTAGSSVVESLGTESRVQEALEPPVAERIEHVQTVHGVEWVDDYYWLRERDNPEVIAYLEAENEYTRAVMAHTEPLQEELYQEILSRIQETDLSVPYRIDDYWYYTRTEEGQAYGLFCRRYGDMEAEEQVVLDQNELAAGQEYLDVGFMAVSPDHQILAYGVDTTGAEEYDVYFKDLERDELYPQVIEQVSYSLVWANDNRTVFYMTQDETHRPYRLYRYILGHEPDSAELVYQEDDDRFFLDVGKTRSEAYLVMALDSQVTSERWVLDADDPQGEFQLIAAREQGVEYDLEHHSDRFYLVTNRGAHGEQAVNFRLLWADVTSPGPENWTELIEHRSDVQLVGVDAFADHLVIRERTVGLPTIRIWNLESGEEQPIEFPETVYSVDPESNPEFDSTTYRLQYTSLITPQTIFDYHMDTGQLELLKERPVLGGYHRDEYQTERVWATAPDGTPVPISLVHRRDMALDGSHPMMLLGYGAYGYPYDPYFSSARLSLLERGFVWGIAHVRGGGEMGRPWYEAGKLLNKRNTFTDFIACAERLIELGYTSSEGLAIGGGSAGGLLIGAVTNMRPDLFAVVVADVPFVDLVNTMLDETIPLTVIEWEEWGNPNDPEFFEVMHSYSPYDNVQAMDYPPMLITTGLNDPRVQYWEPAKWTAHLRRMRTDDNLLILKTNMGAGHFGHSGRYGQLRDLAFEYAFVLDQLGLAE